MRKGKPSAAAGKAAPAASAKTLLAALDRLPVAFALFDAKRRLVAWNAPLAALGLFPKSILRQGAPLAEFQRRDAGLKRKAAGPHDVSLATGKILQVTRRRVPPRQLLLTYVDVTDARLAAQRYDTASRAINEGVYDWDIAGGRTYYSARVVNAVGLTQEELRTAADWLKRIHPEDRPRHEAAVLAHFKGKTERFECDYRFRALDGSWRWARQHGIAIRDARGRAVRMIGSTGDITKLKLGEIELRRAHEETAEALERQTATAEILKVIASSAADVQPVFDAIVASALRLMSAATAHVTRLEGGKLHLLAFSTTDAEGEAALKRLYPISIAGTSFAEALVAGRPIFVLDAETDPEISDQIRAAMRARGVRSNVAMPMVSKGESIGTIVVNRKQAGPFPAHEIELLKTFADQAVIAIENVRLFNETKEALERQTATAEILKVIASSPSDVQPVLDAIVNSAARLFQPCTAVITMREGSLLQLNAMAGPRILEVDVRELKRIYPIPFDPARSVAARAIVERRTIEVPDTEAPDAGEFVRKAGRAAKHRSVTHVPMLREVEGIGSINLTHPEPGFRLSEKQLALIQTFANQAVIAIENVRLFKELEARTDALTRSVGQLTALGEVGQAVSSSLDLESVLRTIASRAVQLSGLDGGAIYEYDERSEEFHVRAAENLSDEIVEMLRTTPIRKGEGAVGRTGITGEPTQIPDTLDESYQSRLRETLVRAGYRALLVVPLLREGHIIGALTVNRKAPGSFAPEIVELLRTFATQSAMAIQNARLFREIADKGRQLEVASRHKSDFLASMSHELRTPLNAILGFNEMILGQIYGEVPQDMQEPLEDIQKSGKHLLRLINNVLDLAKIEAGRMELSLQDYSVQDTVESVRSSLRPLAAEKGLEFLASVPADIPLAFGDAGRITQCLMNLAGNSLKFTKAGKVEISVAAKGDLIVYKVADTGIGIAPDKLETVFAEFKQTDATIASEYGGTGLDLSISRKFVEMHGGRIWVESEPGKGSSFIFEIPLRVSAGAAA